MRRKDTTMRPETWRERYQLLDPVADSTTSFHGRESASSEPVLIHVEPSPSLLLELIALPSAAYAHVRDVGEDHGAPYVVTDLYFGAAGLSAWLQRARSEPVDEPAAPAPAPEPGEFTKLWGSALTPPPAMPKIEHAGEITTLFARKSETSLTPAIVEPSPEPEQAKTPEAPQPGDFTRLLGSAVASKPALEASLPAPPVPIVTGDYTRIVMARPSSPAPPVPPPAAKPPRRDLRPMIVFAALAVLAVILILLAAFGR